MIVHQQATNDTATRTEAQKKLVQKLQAVGRARGGVRRRKVPLEEYVLDVVWLAVLSDGCPLSGCAVVIEWWVVLPLHGVCSLSPVGGRYFSLHHNEYIVYDPSQVRMRYLVVVE